MKYFVLLILFFSSIDTFAQQKVKLDYAKDPVWISMMEQDGGNYYETVKAFDTYWASRTKPVDVEAEDMPKGKEYTQKKMNKRQKKKNAKAASEQEMIYQVKRFRKWKADMQPYVQEDGTILNSDERLKLWKASHTETVKE
jgi:hypothetical protein